MNRLNYLKSSKIGLLLTVLFCLFVITGCQKDTDDVDVITNTDTDGDLEELNQVLEQIPSENVNINDLKFDDGESMIEFLEQYDPEFFERNSEFLSDYVRKSPMKQASSKNNTLLRNSSGTLGIFYEQRRIVGALSNAALFYLKNKDGVAENSFVRETLNDGKTPAQKGLYYSWGSKFWNVRQQQPENKSCKEEYYGLDCSGLLKHILISAGFDISVWLTEEHNAHGYYTTPSKWNKTLKNDYNKKLQFKRYKKDDLPNKEFLMGDIVCYFDSKGVAKHIGIVIKKNGQLLIAQSNGSSTDCIEASNTATHSNGNPKGNNHIERGPRVVELSKTFGYKDIRVIRLVAEGIPISISIPNITSTAATAKVVINPKEISLEPSEKINLVGVCYSQSNPTPTITSNITSGQASYQTYNSSLTSYSVGLTNLSPETQYFVRGFIKTSAGNYIYGDVIKFVTEEDVPLHTLSLTLTSTMGKGSESYTCVLKPNGICQIYDLYGNWAQNGNSLSIQWSLNNTSDCKYYLTGTLNGSSYTGSYNHYDKGTVLWDKGTFQGVMQ